MICNASLKWAESLHHWQSKFRKNQGNGPSMIASVWTNIERNFRESTMAAPSLERSLTVFPLLALLVENGKEQKCRFRHLEECSESAGRKRFRRALCMVGFRIFRRVGLPCPRFPARWGRWSLPRTGFDWLELCIDRFCPASPCLQSKLHRVPEVQSFRRDLLAWLRRRAISWRRIIQSSGFRRLACATALSTLAGRPRVWWFACCRPRTKLSRLVVKLYHNPCQWTSSRQ